MGGGGNSLNIIHLNSENIHNNIIYYSTLKDMISAQNAYTWNIFSYLWTTLQNNNNATCYIVREIDHNYYHEASKVEIATSGPWVAAVRFSIEFKEDNYN